MAIVVKTSVSANGELVTISERPYLNPHVSEGTLAYVWRSETMNGDGLTSRAIVERCQPNGEKLSLQIRLVGGAPQRPLTIAMLAPYRDDAIETPLASLAHKLYRHAHNKVVELSPDEAALIDQHFEAVRSSSP